jgi:aryl-alcohol dehydrogenase-like predicted oxidoreductase
MERRQLGRSGLEVSALGLGCMSMSGSYGPSDERESLATIERALELGVDFLDTADWYGHGHNEELVGRAIRGRRDAVVLATKVGLVRRSSGIQGVDGSPRHIRTAFEAGLRRLGVDHVELLYLHRVDPGVPIEESVGAMGAFVAEGKARFLGLSEVSAATLRRAHAGQPIAALQSEYSLWTRDVEEEILPTCRELGVGIVPFSPLGRGFLTGHFDTGSPGDLRSAIPRFQGENLERNLRLAGRIQEMAGEKKCTAAQLALAWVLARGRDVVPIPGTKQRTYLEENVGALEIELSPEELARLDAIAPPGAAAGDRYSPDKMKLVDR